MPKKKKINFVNLLVNGLTMLGDSLKGQKIPLTIDATPSVLTFSLALQMKDVNLFMNEVADAFIKVYGEVFDFIFDGSEEYVELKQIIVESIEDGNIFIIQQRFMAIAAMMGSEEGQVLYGKLETAWKAFQKDFNHVLVAKVVEAMEAPEEASKARKAG